MPAQHRTVDADASVNAGAASTDVRSPKNVAAALQQTLTLLSARDDTSRFVGLALVKSLLDNHETLRNESGTVAKCWDAVPAIFLDRLLRANAVAAGKAAKADVNATEIETADGDQHAKAKSAGEAKNMVDLAVGVIHSFALLLSGSSGHDKKLVERTPSLMAVLGRSPSSDTRTRILQTLVSFQSGGLEGSRCLAHLDHSQLSPLLDICIPTALPESSEATGKDQHAQQMALDVIKYAFLNVSTGADISDIQTMLRQRLNEVVDALIMRSEKGMRETRHSDDVLNFFAFLADLVPKMTYFPSNGGITVPALQKLSRLVRQYIMSRPRLRQGDDAFMPTGEHTEGEGATAILCSALLQTYPANFPQLLFGEVGNVRNQDQQKQRGKREKQQSDTKPFAYLFPTAISIDLRASFPPLHEILTSSGASAPKSQRYRTISTRMAADFNILSAFLSYLMSTLSSPDGLQLDPNLIQKLRCQFAETSSLAIEFLRDWWDASAGALSRVGEQSFMHAPLLLTADDNEEEEQRADSQDRVDNADTIGDQLILSAVSYVALWLREDDNEELRKEAVGILDVLLALYQAGEDHQDRTDASATLRAVDNASFKSPVLVALEGILTSEDGIEAFERARGWRVLATDLSGILRNVPKSVSTPNEIRRGIETVRVLFQLVESEAATGGTTGEERMAILKQIAGFPPPQSTLPSGRDEASATEDGDDDVAGTSNGGESFLLLLELRISSYQLAAALLEHAARALQRRYAAEAAKIKQAARGVVGIAQGTGGVAGRPELFEPSGPVQEQITGAEEVVQWLDELRL